MVAVTVRKSRRLNLGFQEGEHHVIVASRSNLYHWSTVRKQASA
jgi:hypothetical protein